MGTTDPTPCPACGAPAQGNFCSACGASLGPRQCAACGVTLSPQARFCHRCGRPTANTGGQPAVPGGTAPAAAAGRRGSERTAWIVAGVLIVAFVGGLGYRLGRDAPAASPAPMMANPGNAGPSPSAGGLALGRGPDISGMSPRERFDRLFNRIMTAAERGDSATIVSFTPMALGAYERLDTVDVDARYHAAVLMLQVGEVNGARALADTILQEQPGHLFAYVIRGEAARTTGDDAALAQAYRDFLGQYERETGANRLEYREHAPALERFRAEAAKP